MRGHGLLYLEELNRIPEETLNVLITVLTEGEITAPRLGHARAAAGFRLIAAMNPFGAIGTARVGRAPARRRARGRAAAGFRLIAAMTPFDAIGTARVGQAIADRMCRVVLGYQDAAAERAIAGAVPGAHPGPRGGPPPPAAAP